ncbi:MAG: dienelactone hydrolase family protein [Acidobacteriota bacterium]|nr:dienelactone hydrolase family protein [Blastocatellia bacterium]MDW8413528.1 dienelactone hydrolase family protein [Acidobacteriota bacterium]
MGEWIELQADDGHRFDCYFVNSDTKRGGIVVIQEIFGVNAHIRSVAEGFAAQGYSVAAPALFDRIERKVMLDYTAEAVTKGRKLRLELGWEKPILDLKAAVTMLAQHGKVATIGYCWGGSLAWLSASKLDIACAVGYYGGQIVQLLDKKPTRPIMLHFGEKDELIPMSDVDKIRNACPDAEIYIYGAGHGFNCDQRADYDAECSKLALQRTLDFLAKHLR